jgi:hypothetical protein
MRHFHEIELKGRREAFLPQTYYTEIPQEVILKSLKAGSRILFINYTDPDLMVKISEMLDQKVTILCYEENISRVLEARKRIANPNILLIHSSFSFDELEPSSIDLAVASKVLGSHNGKKILGALNRMLSSAGRFYFLELISKKSAPEGYGRYFRKNHSPELNRVLFDFEKIMGSLKKIRMDLRVIGNGNFYFKTTDINSLQEFLDALGHPKDRRGEILSDIFIALIEVERVQS